MTSWNLRRLWLTIAVLAVAMNGAAAPQDTESPAQAGEQVGIMATFVRAAENQEGWVVVGYGTANESVGKDWMMLNVGITLQKGVKDQKLTRDDVTLVTPERQITKLATQKEVEQARATLDPMSRADAMIHESINYFPAGVTRPCRIGFFTDPSQMQLGPAYDEVELNTGAACVGRLYFKLPKPLAVGTYNLAVQLEDSVIRVPIEIMTKEQAKAFEKKWKEAQKEAKHTGH